ncbi:MAG: LacI family DNA-binding transcriptional regulator [Candidatus Marinimicrobia bacterium]|nr:LacI family DNA-binding transcriptional regulator [Candidatus Neomarinimicrobiota bacterium]
MAKVAIKDIAKMLHTSTATVSRALNDHPAIKKETREKVMKLVNEVGYRPNTIAKNLKMQRSTTIGILVPNIGHDFFARAISAIEKVVSDAGFTAMICQSHENIHKEKEAVKTLIANRVAGVLASISQETTSPDHFRELQSHEIPVVFFDRCFDEGIAASKVITDDFSGSLRAVKYLIKTGYKRIACLAGTPNLNIARERLRGYKQALQEAGLTCHEKWIVPCGMEKQDGKIALQQLMQLDEKPDAIFCINDPVAIGVYQQLQVYKMKIPDDVAVIGFSNNEISALIQPALTTVDQSAEKMGERAGQILISQIQNKQEGITGNTIEIMEANLIVRDSA